MSSLHVVETLRFDFAFGSETEAFELQDRIGRFAAQRAAGVIEQVFDEHAGGEDLWRLELLELELGVLPLHESDDDWDSRLREALKRRLHDCQAAPADLPDRDPGFGLQRQTRADADLELVWRWLHHGTLPWHAARQDRIAFDGMVQRVLEQHGAVLARAMRQSPDAPRLLRRAAHQWSAAAWARLGAWPADDQPPATPGPGPGTPGTPPGGGHEAGIRHPAGPAAEPAGDAEPDVVARVARAWHDDAEALRQRLSGLSTQDPQWDRLASELAPPQRSALLALLAPPGEVAFVQALAGSAMLQALARPGPAAERAAAVCAATLRALRIQGASGPDRHGLVALTLAELTAWTRTRPGSEPPNAAARSPSAELSRHLAPLLQAEALRLATPAPLLRRLTAWDEQAARQTRLAEAEAEASSAATDNDNDDAAQLHALRDALERQFEAAGLDEASPAWPALVHRDAPWLRERLLLHGRRAAWRRQFGRALAPARWAELLALWAPLADVTRVSRLLSDPIAWAGGHHRAAAELAMLLREWLLTGLLADTEPAFDIVACVRSLVTRRAQHDGLAERAVLAALQARWAGDSDLQGPSGVLPRVEKTLAEPVGGIEPFTPVEGAEAGEDVDAVGFDAVVEAPTAALSQSLASFDAGVAAPARLADPVLSQWLRRLPQRPPPSWRRELAQRLASAATARAVFERLTPGERGELLRRLLPDAARPMQALLQSLRDAAVAAATPLSADRFEAFEWRFICQECFEEGRRFETAGFVRRWCEALASEAGAAPSGALGGGWLPRLQGSLLCAARDDGSAPGAARSTRAPSPAVLAPAPDPVADGATLYLRHAGLVLAGAYLPRLWDRLALTGPNGFVDDDAAERAVHLLHWLACGRLGGIEHELVLNKLLCGIDLQTPLRAEVALGDHETQAVDALLQAMIDHWHALGRTTPAGLREAFLQRQGALSHDETGWRLLVEPRSYDMLLDALPWGYKTLRFPWMKEVLHVQWR